jgi:hypothetical protein
VIGDFNGDGVSDLLTVNTAFDGEGSLSVLFGNGDGTFQRPIHTPRPPGFLGTAVAADFNGDGILDVAVASPSTDSVRVFLGNGDGTFQDPQSFAVDHGPRGLGVGDFNADGFPDLVTANFIGGRDVSVLINAADWSSPVGSPVPRPSVDPSANETGSSTPTQSLPSPLPSWASPATDGALAAPTNEAAGLSSFRLERGVREDGQAGWTDLFLLPEDLPWDSPGWPLG